jgi:hypothetical protein
MRTVSEEVAMLRSNAQVPSDSRALSLGLLIIGVAASMAVPSSAAAEEIFL